MEDRYEIKGIIGQGGLGSVYRAYDTRMNRDVAVKRIVSSSNDPEMIDESTRQLIKEAGALASLQHPHIVTIYDVGMDVEGPYVVMELLTGSPLDELIERAPLVWSDFHELVIQTQEGLIAAHDLGIIHSDLKPSNLMLSWLPSGKFQVKIVDFGLASVSQSQSKEELETLDAVFGSIFFMPPEQFERKPLNIQSDVYSMGCVYYQALAGVYPFDGQTGNEVMDAHLAHHVVHLKELRKDLPYWVCEWVMWQINRYPNDRPKDSRETLSVFLQNDKNPAPPPAEKPKRPPMMIPGSSRPTATTRLTPTVPLAATGGSVAANPKVKTTTAPQPLQPPEGAKPSIYIPIDEPPVAATTPATHIAPKIVVLPRKKQSLGPKLAVLAILMIVLGIAGLFIKKQIEKNRLTGHINSLITIADAPDTTELPLTSHDLDLIFNIIRDPATPKDYVQRFFRILQLGTGKDGADVSVRIVEETANDNFPEFQRKEILGNVLRLRNDSSIVPAMIEYAKQTSDPKSAAAAIEGIRRMTNDSHLPQAIEWIKSNNPDLRAAAEAMAADILGRSPNRSTHVNLFSGAYRSTNDPMSKAALLRLVRISGGEDAVDQLR
ncbi:MAG: protein kinase [Verrucomicrobiota bacterium]